MGGGGSGVETGGVQVTKRRAWTKGLGKSRVGDIGGLTRGTGAHGLGRAGPGRVSSCEYKLAGWWPYTSFPPRAAFNLMGDDKDTPAFFVDAL